jgi:hypothetical protein
MSLSEDKHNALKREWAAARIVVIGGFIIALAVVGYFAYRARQEQIAATPVVHVVKRPDAKTLAKIELAVCSVELMRAKDLGMVPQYGDLASPRLIAGSVPRRFICIAKTHLTQYYIAADLVCDKLTDPRCVSVYRVALRDGTLIYSRPE